jgi:preprotein translocase subunit Sss1
MELLHSLAQEINTLSYLRVFAAMCATPTRDERTKTSQNALLAGILGLINNIGVSVADGLL